MYNTIQTLKKLDYSEIILFNHLILTSFFQLIDKIQVELPTIENLIDSLDDMIKRWGKVFSKELVLGFCQLQSNILKKLTQNQSTLFSKLFSNLFGKHLIHI